MYFSSSGARRCATYLPRRLRLQKGYQTENEERPRDSCVNPQPWSLLIVDDEPSILPSLTALLAAEYEIYTASSAEAAQGLFAQHPIDLILTDQKMPEQSGIELLE